MDSHSPPEAGSPHFLWNDLIEYSIGKDFADWHTTIVHHCHRTQSSEDSRHDVFCSTGVFCSESMPRSRERQADRPKVLNASEFSLISNSDQKQAGPHLKTASEQDVMCDE
jgi:hypothetical protein